MNKKSGRSSVVEHQLPKLRVAGSIPVARSIIFFLVSFLVHLFVLLIPFRESPVKDFKLIEAVVINLAPVKNVAFVSETPFALNKENTAPATDSSFQKRTFLKSMPAIRKLPSGDKGIRNLKTESPANGLNLPYGRKDLTSYGSEAVSFNPLKINSKEFPGIAQKDKIASYLKLVRKKISANCNLNSKSFPPFYVSFVIDKEGNVKKISIPKTFADISVLSSAISAIFDSEPFPPPPEKKELNIRVKFEP